jgi:tRNA(Ile)-lysidine synthase
MTAFETRARTKRYRALGKACYENGLEALLTGHHLDDNVETAILRLTQRSKREGLAGIAPVARIPECHGLWGLSESGSFQRIASRQQLRLSESVESKILKINTTRDNGLPRRTANSSSFFNMATGGIVLCRPLLPFHKSSILETCHQSNVPYVTDPTNFDSTLTARNAIRSLLSANRLPRALQSSSMSSFLAKNRDWLRDINLQTDELLRECKLIEFHAASSTMTVQFPSSPKTDSARIQAATLRRITELVSPLEDGKPHSLNEYDRFAHMMFTGQQTEGFTVADAHYRLLGPNNMWHISRAPFRARSEPIISINDIRQEWCAPILWDNRYWFEFRFDPSPSSSSLPPGPPLPITIRPLKSMDMPHVNILSRNTAKFKSMLGYTAPFKSRFTLPVMTTPRTTHAADRSSEEEGEIYIALPTLNMRLGEMPRRGRVQWRWGYKKIDVEALRLMGWLDD